MKLVEISYFSPLNHTFRQNKCSKTELREEQGYSNQNLPNSNMRKTSMCDTDSTERFWKC